MRSIRNDLVKMIETTLKRVRHTDTDRKTYKKKSIAVSHKAIQTIGYVMELIDHKFCTD